MYLVELRSCSIRVVLNPTTQVFPGGSVVENTPANAGDTGLILNPGRSHMPWSN